jgi:large subunit ribosomal protein L32
VSQSEPVCHRLLFAGAAPKGCCWHDIGRRAGTMASSAPFHASGGLAALAPPYPRRSSMAVQQNKKSPSKRGMHRSHNAVAAPGTAVESTTGEVHLRHHISPTGFYRGRKVLKTKADA